MEMAQRTYASPPSDLSVLERQRARLVTNWSREHQHQQQQHQNVGSCDQFPFFHLLDNNVIDGTKNEGHGSQVYNPLPCTGSSRGKPDDPTNPKEGATDSSEISASSKRIREDNTAMAAVGEDKKSTTETQKPSKKKAATSNKEGSKESTVTSGAPPSKPDYIHVRARRGQATDSHSLAERVRRERISERMKYLQDLVPGCNNIIGKAGMLDEIINYVQSLQRQVEFLSMKLAAVNPLVDLSMDNFISGKINPAFNGGLTAIEVLPAQEDPPYLQPSSLQQAQPGTGCGLGMAMDTSGMALHSSLNAPQPLADPFFGSCFNVHGSSGWEIGLQNNYASNIQARGVALPIQSLQSNLLPNDLKMV